MKTLFNMYIHKECTLKETMLIKQQLVYYNKDLIEFIYNQETCTLFLYFVDFTYKICQFKRNPWKYSSHIFY